MSCPHAGRDQKVQMLLSDFDHHSKLFQEVRQPFYAEMHRGSSVLRSERYEGFSFFGGHADIMSALRQPEVYSNAQLTIPAPPFPTLVPAGVDPPEHNAYKRLLARYFTPQAAEERRGHVRRLIDVYLIPAIKRGRFDLIEEVMQPLVCKHTMDQLGLDPPDISVYTKAIHHGTLQAYPRDLAAQEVGAMIRQIEADVALLRRQPRGLMGELVAADFQDRKLTDEELRGLMLNLLIGGLATTPIFAGSSVVFLARNPDHRKVLADDPTRIRPALNELLRAFGPVQVFARVVKQETALGGCTLAPGDRILLGYGAANHDPRSFDDPDEIDFDRDASRHLSFGFGIHRCLGAHIAMMIMTEFLTALLERAPEYVVDEQGLGAYEDVAARLGFHRVPVLTQ